MLIEMTLITPLMLAISAGVFEFGNLIQQKLLVEAGLRDGARYASRCNSQMYTDYGLAAIDGAGVMQYRSVTPLVCIVRATSSFDYPGVGLLNFLGIGPITLNGVHEERIIRF